MAISNTYKNILNNFGNSSNIKSLDQNKLIKERPCNISRIEDASINARSDLKKNLLDKDKRDQRGIVASPIQSSWRSNNYVSAVRLVECKLVIFIQ